MYKILGPTPLEEWLRRIVRPGPDAIWNKVYFARIHIEVPDDQGVLRRVEIDYAGSPKKDFVVILARLAPVEVYETTFVKELAEIHTQVNNIKIPNDTFGKPAFEITVVSTWCAGVYLTDKMQASIGEAIGKIVPVERSWRAEHAYCSYQINPENVT